MIRWKLIRPFEYSDRLKFIVQIFHDFHKIIWNYESDWWRGFEALSVFQSLLKILFSFSDFLVPRFVFRSSTDAAHSVEVYCFPNLTDWIIFTHGASCRSLLTYCQISGLIGRGLDIIWNGLYASSKSNVQMSHLQTEYCLFWPLQILTARLLFVSLCWFYNKNMYSSSSYQDEWWANYPVVPSMSKLYFFAPSSVLIVKYPSRKYGLYKNDGRNIFTMRQKAAGISAFPLLLSRHSISQLISRQSW